VQTTGAKNGASIWLRVDRDAKQLMLDNGLDEPQVGDTTWTRRKVSLPVPPEATMLTFGVLLQPGGGTVSVRNLRLEPGPRFDASGSIAPAAQKVLDAAISIVKTNALRASSVAWPVVEPEIRAYAAGAEQSSDVYPAIRLLLSKLGDRHSSLMTPSATSRFSAGGSENQPADVRSLNGDVGYINVPAYAGGDQAAARAYAARVHDGLAKTSASATCGWIVDLRANTGGNMWPMLAALKPLLGNGAVGSFGSLKGSGMQWIAGSGVDAAPPVELSVFESAWVAVLTGPRTLSSGEAVAVAFRGRARARSFGQPTGGLSTANSRFGLPDGSTILLTIAVDVDRTGRRYGDKVDPDELIEPGAAPGVAADDPTVAAAIKWLKQSSGCGK
jgi:C-terminal processing protease CtpA/Prc